MISYVDDIKVDEHPYYKRVYLRVMPVAGGTPKVVAYVYGGQGTINVPSWSPDGRMNSVSYPNFRTWQAENRSMESMRRRRRRSRATG